MQIMALTMPFFKSALLLAALLPSAKAQFTIQPAEFYAGATAGIYDAIIDVRSEGEWNDGHVRGFMRSTGCLRRSVIFTMLIMIPSFTLS
jgi:hypothetical protein